MLAHFTGEDWLTIGAILFAAICVVAVSVTTKPSDKESTHHHGP